MNRPADQVIVCWAIGIILGNVLSIVPSIDWYDLRYGTPKDCGSLHRKADYLAGHHVEMVCMVGGNDFGQQRWPQ